MFQALPTFKPTQWNVDGNLETAGPCHAGESRRAPQAPPTSRARPTTFKEPRQSHGMDGMGIDDFIKDALMAASDFFESQDGFVYGDIERPQGKIIPDISKSVRVEAKAVFVQPGGEITLRKIVDVPGYKLE